MIASHRHGRVLRGMATQRTLACTFALLSALTNCTTFSTVRSADVSAAGAVDSRRGTIFIFAAS